MARMQILNFGWRLGLEEAEAARVFTEGTALAERSGNPHASCLVKQLYASVKDAEGEAEEGLQLRKEALGLAKQSGDPGLELATETGIVFSLWQTGRLREALALAEKVLAKAADSPRLGAEIYGFSPYVVTFHFRVMVLTYLGRLREALGARDRAIQLAREHGETEILGWAHGNSALLAHFTGDPRGVLDHTRSSLEIAEKIGSPISRMMARWSLGTSKVLSEEWRDAREALEASEAIARETRAGLFGVPAVLALLAQSYLGLGEENLARKTADEAIRAARLRCARLFVCEAHLARARVLLATQGAKARDTIEADLAEASALVQETGMKGQEPFVHEARAALAGLLGDEAARGRALREAHRLFTEMGATAHAARLAKELGL